MIMHLHRPVNTPTAKAVIEVVSGAATARRGSVRVLVVIAGPELDVARGETDTRGDVSARAREHVHVGNNMIERLPTSGVTWDAEIGGDS